MYCSECGTKNDRHALYCVEDGYPLQQLTATNSLQLNHDIPCKKCGTKNDPSALYCIECGDSLDRFDSSEDEPQSNTYFNGRLGKKVLPGLLLSISVLLLINQFIASSLKTKDLYNLSFGVHLPPGVKLNVLDYLLFSNLTNISLTMSNEEFTNHITYSSSGMIFMVFIAAFSLIAGGFFIKYLNPNIKEWKAAVCLAVGHALFLGIVSFFAGADIVDSEFNRTSFTFNMGSAILNGLFLGFLFSYAGMKLKKIIYREKTNSVSFQRPVYFGIFGFGIGYLILLLISAIMFSQYEPQIDQGLYMTTGYEKFAFVSKIAVYFFNFVLFNTFVLKSLDPKVVEFSFLSEADPKNTGDLSLFIPPGIFESYEVLSISVIAVLFIFVGRFLAKSQQRIIISITLYSIVFGVIMTFFTHHASLDYHMQNNQLAEGSMDVLAGFEMIRTFITSIIYASITALIGVQSRKLF